jgi:hypothetical protein
MSYPPVKVYEGGTIDVADRMSGKVPVALEVGLRFPRVFVGAFADIGQVWALAPGCVGRTCSGLDVLLGFTAQVHPWPHSTIDPWIGGGWGVESLPGPALTCPCTGITGLASIGLDVRLGDYLAIGPLAMVSGSLLVGGEGGVCRAAGTRGSPSEAGSWATLRTCGGGARSTEH